MPQNIYDDPEFFRGYMDLRENESGLNAVLEEPAVVGLLPPLAGLDVLDLGCGFGRFAAYCLANGAASVHGVDLSENMLAEARRRVADPRARFTRQALEELEAPAGSADLVTASLCLHYLRDLAPLVEKVAAALRPGGTFVFSVEHPMCTASYRQQWVRDAEGRPQHWPVDNYRMESIRATSWFVDGVLKYHRTTETYVNTLLDAGLTLRRLLEPEPTPESIAARPDLAEQRRRPPFLVLAADQRG
jgi:SAM-dependent methyltransferase